MGMTTRMTTLPSGLRIVTDTMPELATVSLGLWFGVGTRNEPSPLGGLSHMLEHMFFKGTTTRDVKTLNRTIEDVGGYLNAYTSREQTAYHVRVLAEDTPLAMELLADIMLNSRFDPADIEREKSVIAQEIGEAYDTPDDHVFDLFQSACYSAQPLGQPVLGNVQTLAPVTRADLLAHVAAFYRTGNAVLSAAGAIDHEAFVALAEKLLAGMPQGQCPLPSGAQFTGTEQVEERDSEQLHICLGLPGVPFGHPDFNTQSLLAMALGGGTSSRLFHELREERGLAYSISASPMTFIDSGVVVIYAATEPERAGEAVPAALEQLVKLADEMDEPELARAKALLRAGLLMDLESPMARAERMATQLLVLGKLVSPEESLAAVERVTLADVKAFAHRLLQGPLARAAVGPLAALEPFSTTAERLRG